MEKELAQRIREELKTLSNGELADVIEYIRQMEKENCTKTSVRALNVRQKQIRHL